MTESIVVTGTVTNGTTVHLDRPLSLDGARVKLIIEPMGQNVEPKMTMMEAVAKIRASQKERGHVPMTTEELDALLNAVPLEDE